VATVQLVELFFTLNESPTALDQFLSMEEDFHEDAAGVSLSDDHWLSLHTLSVAAFFPILFLCG